MSSPGSYIAAAWRDHGAGTISEAHVAAPSRRARYTPTLAAWHRPRSSQEMITSRASAGWPRRSASEGEAGAPGSATGATLSAARAPQAESSASAATAAATKRAANTSFGRDRQRAGVALPGDRLVDERAVGDEVDVGEQAPVVVAPDDVALQAHGRAGGQQRAR